MMWGYPGYGYGGSWIGMILMMFFGLVFLAGIVVLIVWLARGPHYGGPGPYGPGGPQSGTQRACDIAKERYARGEISKEQYDDICRNVSS